MAFAILFAIVAAVGFAEPADNFKKGGLEFGGDIMFTYEPDYAVFNADEREQNKGEYRVYLDGSIGIGMFVIDDLSVNVLPYVLYQRRRTFNDLSGKENMSQSINIGLQLGANYYLHFGSSLTAGFGLKGGLTFMPGLDRISDDVKEENKSLDVYWTLEPNAGLYYFLTENLAPYFEPGSRYTYSRDVKASDGSDYSYPDGYSIFDYVELKLYFGLGLKVFLPPSRRSTETKEYDLPDFNDIIGK